ncbi:MAG: DUF3482 domain-containing protein [Phycisphaerales bacterium]|nr:MAG: DUF3482 domain-containing protein [Phycisphaerales bacterium]
MSDRPLIIAVVGHTNTGKTSLMRTLTHDASFGEVSDRPAVTRDVAGIALMIEDHPVAELYDTPGLEDSIALLDHLHNQRGDHRRDNVEVIRDFLQTNEAGTSFSQEAKVLRQVLKSDVALYVIDARDRVLGKHRDELEILRMCGRPVVPVLNFIASADAQTSLWRDHLSRLGLHAVAEFDTVVVDELSEQHLFEKMRTLLDEHRNTIDRLIDDRHEQRRMLIASSARVIAELLVDIAALRLLVPRDDKARLRESGERLRDLVREREQRCVRDLLELHRFHPDDCTADTLPIEDGRWKFDPFDPEVLQQFGIRAGSGAAAGAMAGLAVDLAVGGMSLGAAAATGAAIGAVLGGGQSHARRLFHRMRGLAELRVDDGPVLLLAARQIDLVRALLRRGHASQSRVTLETPEMKVRTLPKPLRRARMQTNWCSIDTESSSNSPRPLSFRSTSPRGRDAALDELSGLIEPDLPRSRSQPITLDGHVSDRPSGKSFG